MRICAVWGCKNEGAHRFPTDENLRQQWVKATRVDVQRKIGWHLRKYSCICSDHFRPSDFVQHDKLRRLQKASVPSVFPWAKPPDIDGDVFVPSPSSETDIDFIGPDTTQKFFNTTFNPANAIKKYGRPDPSTTFVEEVLITADPPTTFVEEYPTLNVETPAKNEPDPLLISDVGEYTEYLKSPSPVLEEIPVEEELMATVINEIQDEIPKQHEINTNSEQKPQYCDKSVQTVRSTESHSETDHNFFSVRRYKNSDKAIHFFTGLETFEKLTYVLDTLGNYSDLKYFYDTSPKLEALEQFFIALMILRRHNEFEEIAIWYCIPVIEVTDIFITWIRFMALQWKNLKLWINKEAITAMTKLVLDFTECPIKEPELPLAQKVTFSSYENRNTVKFLLGIAPSGLITYISPCYGGSATDRQILEKSNILPKFNYNDKIVYKCLSIKDMVKPDGVKVKKVVVKGKQIKPVTLVEDRMVASKGEHVERINAMMKDYKILKEPMNQTETVLASEIAFVCAIIRRIIFQVQFAILVRLVQDSQALFTFNTLSAANNHMRFCFTAQL